MIFLLGFRTPNLSEVPEILYIGDDGDEVIRIAEASKHPRLARMVNPQLFPLRHWSEEAAAAFEQSKSPTLSTTPPIAPASSEESDSPNPAEPVPAPAPQVPEEVVASPSAPETSAAEPAPSATAAESAEEGPQILPSEPAKSARRK